MPTPRNWCLFSGGALLGAALAFRLVWSQEAAIPGPGPAELTVQLPGPAPVAMTDAIAVEPAIEASRPAQAQPQPQTILAPASNNEAALAEIAGQNFSDDPFALRRVAAHLQHPAPAVRVAARDALRVAGDPAAVPELQLALDIATDADEAIELADLIAYLQLPTYTELRGSGQWASGAGAQRARVAAGVPVKVAPSSASDGSATALDPLASLRAENDRLRLENQRLRTHAGLAAMP